MQVVAFTPVNIVVDDPPVFLFVPLRHQWNNHKMCFVRIEDKNPLSLIYCCS